MRRTLRGIGGGLASIALLTGCATQKETDTARTGVEQLLISSAVDRALNKVDLTPVSRRRVYLDTTYLDCVDKNYVIVSMHQRLLNNDSVLVAKAEDADVIMEIGSGCVGTDRQELFVGVPEIPLPPPSPIAIPKLAFVNRAKMMGTAKFIVVAYDSKTKQPIINENMAMARTDQKNWNILGAGPMQTGKLPEEIAVATGERELDVGSVTRMVAKTAKQTVAPSDDKKVVPVKHNEDVEHIMPGLKVDSIPTKAPTEE